MYYPKFYPGTTLAECKSGYGLDTTNEVKMLRVLNRGIKDGSLPLDISVTYCGAHAVPASVLNNLLLLCYGTP